MSFPILAARTPRQDWATQAVISGFLATGTASVVLIGAYIASQAAGQAGDSHNVLVQWLYNLTHNAVTTRATDGLYAAILLHVTFGLLWAGIYAYAVEPAPALAGPAWRRGLLFALGPFILSIVVLLPVLGGGIFGASLNAGPLPVIGNFVVHAVYGIVLGVMYNLAPSGRADSNGRELRSGNGVERGAGLGIVTGAVLGGVAGMIVGLFSGNGSGADHVLTGVWQLCLFGAVLGSVAGALVGSMMGLSDADNPRN